MTGCAPRGPCIWLFPVSYVAHAAEEYWCGDTFPTWISDIAGVHFTAASFLWLNGTALALMLAAAWRVTRAGRPHLLVATLATIVVVTGTAHAAGSILSSSYSPGLVTGILLWMPLGGWALRYESRELPRRAYACGVALGVFAHAVVTTIVLTSHGS